MQIQRGHVGRSVSAVRQEAIYLTKHTKPRDSSNIYWRNSSLGFIHAGRRDERSKLGPTHNKGIGNALGDLSPLWPGHCIWASCDRYRHVAGDLWQTQ